MFITGDTVMHPAEGVCTVENVTSMSFSGMPARMYYVLHPATEKSSAVVYMPVERGDAVLRRLLSREDILALIRASREQEDIYIADSRMRRDAYTKLLASGDYAKIIRMIAILHEERERRAADGRKPCATDEAILTQAERLVHQEFSRVLGLSLPDTIAFIRRQAEPAPDSDGALIG
ncbi:MAG: hypothetical protein J6K32_08150 [Clostridia bacterium]|nr:hypothetical protein [Clostridia bacterium]